MDNRKFRSRTTSAVALAAVSTLALVTSSTPAAGATPGTVVFDLRVHGTGAKTVDVTQSGETVQLDLYATVLGSDANTQNDTIGSAGGRFTSATGGLSVNILGLTPPSPFNAIGANPGLQVDFDGDGDLDIWSASDSDNGNYWFRRPPPYPLPQPAGGSLVGRVQVTVGAFSLSETAVAYSFVNNPEYVVGWLDGGIANGFTLGIQYGAPVTIRGVTLTPPAGVVYLDGTIATHNSITQNTWVTPTKSLEFQTGVDVQSGGALNAAGQPLTINVNDATSGNFGGDIIGATLAIGTTANGTFTQSSGATNAAALTVGASAANTGKLNVAGGSIQSNTLTLGGAGAGAYAQTGGAAEFVNLNVAKASTGNVSGGTLTIIGASIIGNGSAGTFTHAGGGANLAAVTIGQNAGGTGTLNITGGTAIAGQTLLGVAGGSGTLNVSGGNYKAATITTPSAGGPARVNISGTGVLDVGTTVFVSPVVFNQTGGTLNIGALGSLTMANRAGDYQYAISGGMLNTPILNVGKTHAAPVAVSGHIGGVVQSGGTVNATKLKIDATGTYEALAGTINIGGTLDLRGKLDFGGGSTQLNVGSSAFASFVQGQLLNASAASFAGASGSLISFKDQAQYDSVGSITSSGLIHIAGQALVVPQNASIGGSGTIEGNLTNNGAIAPGNSPGALAVNGTFNQAGTGSLEIELAGTAADAFDTLSVTGAATIDGFLNISLLGDYVPTSSDSFTILTVASLAGTFDNVVGGEVNVTGGSFDVTYSPNAVTLSGFTPVPEPAGVSLLTAASVALVARRRRSRLF